MSWLSYTKQQFQSSAVRWLNTLETISESCLRTIKNWTSECWVPNLLFDWKWGILVFIQKSIEFQNLAVSVLHLSFDLVNRCDDWDHSSEIDVGFGMRNFNILKNNGRGVVGVGTHIFQLSCVYHHTQHICFRFEKLEFFLKTRFRCSKDHCIFH